MKFTVLLFLICLSGFLNGQVKENSSEPFSIGEVRKIQSEILNEERTLNIYLPNGFDKEKTYPVIYLLDGSANEDMLHIAGLVQFFNMMYEMPEFIVVGIGNTDRKRDFTFPTDLEDLKKKYPTTGHSAAFIEFIKNELQPYIESVYKTNSTKYLIGQSLGGLLATEILLKNPELFTHYFITSPSLWWDNESLLKDASGLLNENHSKVEFVYIAVGNKEDKLMIKEAKEISEILKKLKFKPKKTTYKEIPETHATILHQSIMEAFKILFKERYP